MNLVPIRHNLVLHIGIYLTWCAILFGNTHVSAQNPIDKEQRRLAVKSSRQGRFPQGIIPLLKLWRNWDRASVSVTTELLDKLAKDRRLSTSRRVLVQALLAVAHTRRGNIKSATEEFSNLGYVTKWRILGPFDNEGKSGFDRTTPVETNSGHAPDMNASYQGRERQIKWRIYPDVIRYGYVSLDAVFRPNNNVCGIAETTIYSDQARLLTLWIGAGGALKAYWNGQEVFSDATYRSSPFRDRSAALLRARKGNNRLLIKSCTTNMRWGFFLRLGDHRGGVAKGLTYKLSSSPPSDEAKGRLEEQASIDLSMVPLEALDSLVAKQPQNASVLEDLARYLTYTGSDDPKERRAKQLAAQACKLQPTLSRLRLAAALAEERGEVLLYAARAKKLWPKHPESLWMQAAVIREGPTPEDALPLLESIPEQSLYWDLAVRMRASILQDLELTETAFCLIQSAIKRHSPTLVLLQSLANLASATGRLDQSISYHQQILQIRFDNLGSRRFLINDALQKGKDSQVLEHIDILNLLFPGSARNLRFLAKMFIAVERDDMALASYREAIELAPEDAITLVEYGRALLRAGYQKGGADSFRQALSIRPQDAETRELLEQLEQKEPEKRFDEVYAIPAESLLEKHRKKGEYPATILQNLTVNTVFENGLGSSFTQLVVQVNNTEGARNWRTHSIQFDPDSQRVELRLARIYRADGGGVSEFIQTYEQQLGQPWYRLYYDTRALTVIFPDLEPGDTIELRYRVDDIAHRNLFADYYGDLHTLQDFIPTERIEYVLITPTSRKFYFHKPLLDDLKHTRQLKGKQRIDRFLITDLPAIHAEEGMPGLTQISPYIHVSTYRSWKDVGRWYWGLIKDQLYADESLKNIVKSLIKEEDDTRSKVQHIYEWVVRKTRYVGLEFGIHGFLPYRVPLVVQRGFGDCKDKAALMYTMLKVAGIDSRIVLTRTRRNGNISTKPASLAVFDHAIVYIPELDLYLDGTAEHSGTTELPTGDQGVMVLRVGKGVSELRFTPVFDSKRNQRNTFLKIQLASDGSASVEGKEEVVGSDAANYRSYYQALGTRSQRFERTLALKYPGVELKSLKFEPLSDLENPIRFSYQMSVPQIAYWNGDVLRVSLTEIKDLLRYMARSPTRKYLLDLEGTQLFRERREIEIPVGLHAEQLPAGGEAISKFGRIRIKIESGPQRVVSETTFEVNCDRVTPKEYSKFRLWIEQADRLLRQRIEIGRDTDE